MTIGTEIFYLIFLVFVVSVFSLILKKLKRLNFKVELIIIISIVTFFVNYNYKFNYNWRYPEIISKIKNIPHGDVIKKINMSPHTTYAILGNKGPGIDFDITIKENYLNNYDKKKLAQEIKAVIDETIYYGMPTPLERNSSQIYLRIKTSKKETYEDVLYFHRSGHNWNK